MCSLSTLSLIFSPHQASGTCCTWVLRRKGRLCPTDCKSLLQCRCAQSRRGCSSSSTNDTFPSSICYSDAPQGKEWFQAVLPAAFYTSLRQPRSSWKQEYFQTMCVVLPGPPPSACSLGPLFFWDTFGSVVQEGKGGTRHFVLVHAEELLIQDTDPSAQDTSGRVFRLSH